MTDRKDVYKWCITCVRYMEDDKVCLACLKVSISKQDIKIGKPDLYKSF